MYTTSQIVETIKLQAQEWSTLGTRSLLSMINLVDHKMANADVDHNVVIDSSTGLPPYLVTQAGKFQYNCPSNCRKVASVFYEDLAANQERSRKYGERQRTTFLDRRFYEEPVVSRRRMVSSSGTTVLPTVTFRDDPGDTTEIYHLKYYLDATDITSINIQPNIDPDFHDLLIDGVLARIQPIQYGDENPWLQWLERMKLEYWGDMNYNPPRPVNTPTRPC